MEDLGAFKGVLGLYRVYRDITLILEKSNGNEKWTMNCKLGFRVCRIMERQMKPKPCILGIFLMVCMHLVEFFGTYKEHQQKSSARS